MEDIIKTIDTNLNNNHINEVHRINYLTTEMESLYHAASLRMGISDSTSIILYSIYDNNGTCLLNDICKKLKLGKNEVISLRSKAINHFKHNLEILYKSEKLKKGSKNDKKN